MAQKMRVELIDDIDGGMADETVTFALDGVSYEIDLSEGHAEQLRENLDQYVTAARRTGGRARRGAPGPARSGPGDLEKVRAWARVNGYDVKDRGRVSSEVMRAYREATV